MLKEHQSPVQVIAPAADEAEPYWHVDSGQDTDAFREAMRRVITGVTVITTVHDGKPWGMTVSAFTPVCMTPPTLLVCVNENTVTANDIAEDGRFGVNLLSQSQLHVSQFCSRPGEDKYLHGHLVDDGELPEHVSVPVLRDSIVTFQCRVANMSVVGTHHVVIGAIEAILAPRLLPPLLYGQGAYLHGIALDTTVMRSPGA
ncbi:flavin reductase family protein [Sphingopyxis sp. MG]|uniref:flavin reductase family protein n=1 Tax=Sphingopyxis sp. MG TaxID=1866325 RepID=UPI00131A1C94|nr:flavin reductase family protein [Sphingopyxis sp. MG]